MFILEQAVDSPTLSLTSALHGGGWLTPSPSCLTARKESRYLLYRKLDGGGGGSNACLGRCEKSSPPPGFDPQTVQPVASRYTDYAIPPHLW
jgi:hypothetical protein